MDTTGVGQLITIFLLLILSAFFSSAETAFTTTNHVRMKTLADDGNKAAIRVEAILSKYSKMLSTILVGNNLVNISASSMVTSLTIRVFGNVYVGVATGILTLVILILGEIVPKNWATVNCDKLSLSYSGIIKWLMIIMTPVVFVIDKVSRGVMFLVHVDPDARDEQITEDELKNYVDVSHEGGEIEEEEHEMIYNVLEFSDAEARDIMIPRESMSAVGVDDSYDTVLEHFKENMFTRLPVWKDENDNFIGLVNIKDFILVEDRENFKIEDILREVIYTVEHKKTFDLMGEMREKSLSLALVLNEYGSCVGMITMEDLLEEIVGDIRDEFDEDEEELIQQVGSRRYLIEASMKTDDVNDSLGTAFSSEDYDSIGGLMIEQLERMPEDGEVVELADGSLLQAKGVHQNRILKVLLTIAEPRVESEEETEKTEDKTPAAEPETKGDADSDEDS